jgi:tetratricopeptide (TPR) repeat protein
MLFAVSDLCWRTLCLLWLALAPYAAPVDVTRSSSTLGASLRLGASLACFALIVFGLSRLARVSRWGAALGALALSSALAGAAFFGGDRGPLARGLVWTGPILWGVIAVVAAGPLANLTARHQDRPEPKTGERAAFAAAVILVGGLGVAAAWRRVGSEAALLRAALRNDPGQERAATRLALLLERGGDPEQSMLILEACADANGDACGCALPVIQRRLDRGAYAEAGAVLKRLGKPCQDLPGTYGMLAETLAGAGFMVQAEQAADLALGKNRGDARALYAKAVIALQAGDAQTARRRTEAAIAAGRGSRARLLLGLVLYQTGDFEGARATLEKVIEQEPRDTSALHGLGLLDQRQGRRERARERYLRVLALDPKHLDARYGLGVLAHEMGLKDEARRDLAELAKLARPDDPRLVALRKLVAD